MKKIIKRFLVINVTLMLLLSFCLVVKAWTPPKLKNAYVEPEVEFRSVWVCTVSNMDIGKQIGTDADAIQKWKDTYLEILKKSADNGMNAIIFQVSPCNDAFYPSKYRPWSDFLAGFGVDPGWDPVEWMIEVTHEAGLEYHAWFNPYRTSVTSLSYSITEEDEAGRRRGGDRPLHYLQHQLQKVKSREREKDVHIIHEVFHNINKNLFT